MAFELDPPFKPLGNMTTFEGNSKNKTVGREIVEASKGVAIGTRYKGDYRLDLRNGFNELTFMGGEDAYEGPWPLTERDYAEREAYDRFNEFTTGGPCYPYEPVKTVIMLDRHGFEVILNFADVSTRPP